MEGYRIKNGTAIKGLQVSVSSYTKGSDDWFPLPEDFSNDANCLWPRTGWELIVVKNPTTDERKGWYAKPAEKGVVECTFHGFDQEMHFGPLPVGFRIKNGTTVKGLQVFVSSNTGGSDSWFQLADNFASNATCLWPRNGWELIVVMNPETQERAGWYAKTTSGGALDCTFLGFHMDMHFSCV